MVDSSKSRRPIHPIQVVARRTGLSADVIRVWERRYRAVTPTRSETNRRLYTDRDVERLMLLRRATLGGRRIGDVASLSDDRLRELVAEDEAAAARVRSPAAGTRGGDGVGQRLKACLDAAEDLDAERLESLISDAAADLATPVLLEGLLHPLMTRIGEGWRDGTMRVAHEHMTTSIVRSFLGALQNGRPPSPESRPDILVTTPAGQFHELGALMVAVTAAMDGWRVTYLGPNLPAEEIAAAARQRAPRAIALSLVYPSDDPRLRDELRKIRRLVPDAMILAGGAASEAYQETLRDIGAVRAHDMAALRSELDALRHGSP